MTRAHHNSATLTTKTPVFDQPRAEAAIREYASGSNLKLGEIAQPLRAALTGRLTSPGVFDVLAVLGADESLARIGDKID